MTIQEAKSLKTRFWLTISDNGKGVSCVWWFENKVLVNNYRSTSEIVNFNENFIRDKRANPKDLTTTNDSKMPVYMLENKRDDEYRGIAFIIKNLLDSGKITKYSDVCILFRSHKDKKDILEEFERKRFHITLRVLTI